MCYVRWCVFRFRTSCYSSLRIYVVQNSDTKSPLLTCLICFFFFFFFFFFLFSSVSYCPEGSTTVGSNNLVIPTPDSFSETSSNHLNMRRNTSPNLYPSQTRTQVSLWQRKSNLLVITNDFPSSSFWVGWNLSVSLSLSLSREFEKSLSSFLVSFSGSNKLLDDPIWKDSVILVSPLLLSHPLTFDLYRTVNRSQSQV